MTEISPSNIAGAANIESAGNWPRWLTRRRLLFVGAATAIGLAPVLVSLAPCAAMCGLGLCMKGGSGKGCSKSPEGASPD